MLVRVWVVYGFVENLWSAIYKASLILIITYISTIYNGSCDPNEHDVGEQHRVIPMKRDATLQW